MSVCLPSRSEPSLPFPSPQNTPTHNTPKELYASLKTEYKPSTGSDCEVILPLYLEHGPDFIRLLRGMFSFVLYDKRTDTYMAVRDHMGITPLYVGWAADGAVWFASEMKVVSGSCMQFKQFPPGHYYTSTDRAFHRWYNPGWLTAVERPMGKCSLQDIREHLERAVKRRLMSDVPWGVLLSGGLDSSLVAAIACRQQGSVSHGRGVWTDKIHSFSVGLADSPDLKAAQRAADFLGTIHHTFTYTIQEGLDAIEQAGCSLPP